MLPMLLFRHIVAFILIKYYKIIYGSKCNFGKKTTFRKNFHLVIAKNGKVVIGKDCFFNNDCSINSLGHIHIGDGCLFGEGVKIYDHNHRFCDFSRSIKEQGFSIGTVKIGSCCWIGSNVVLLKGTVIQDHCVIGAGCVISGHIEKGTIVKQRDNLDFYKIKEKK